jgi:hypothetical protein
MTIGMSFARLSIIFTALILVGCAAPRPVSSDYGQFRSTLDGNDVLVAYYKDYKHIRQDSPDLCWAAALQQSLARYDVETDQAAIIKRFYPESDGTGRQTSNLLRWYLHPVFSEHTRNGTEVWIRLDLDHHGSDMYEYEFTSEIADELSANRLPLLGISTGSGQGHMVSVIGAAYPIDAPALTTRRIRGFLVYDPLTAKPYLASTSDLYDATRELVSVYAFDRELEAAVYCGPSCMRRMSHRSDSSSSSH